MNLRAIQPAASNSLNPRLMLSTFMPVAVIRISRVGLHRPVSQFRQSISATKTILARDDNCSMGCRRTTRCNLIFSWKATDFGFFIAAILACEPRLPPPARLGSAVGPPLLPMGAAFFDSGGSPRLATRAETLLGSMGPFEQVSHANLLFFLEEDRSTLSASYWQIA